MKKVSRSVKPQAFVLSAMVIMASAAALPVAAVAQDGGQRWNGEQRDGGRGDDRQWRGQPAAPQQQQPRVPANSDLRVTTRNDDRGQRYQGQNDPRYRDQGGRNNVRMQDQATWTDAQREAYRGAVLEGRATDQFQGRGGDRSPRSNDDRNGPGDRQQAWQRDRDGRGQAQWQGNREYRRAPQWQGNRDNGQWESRAGWQDNRGGSIGREAWRNNGSINNRGWDRGWRSNDRYDWSSYRSSNRNIYSAGRYYSPFQNYSYRRLGIGFSLGTQFYGSRYLINDPYYYRLPETYGPYRWVRYYDDVLLVNTYSGEVVDVIYDFFY